LAWSSQSDPTAAGHVDAYGNPQDVIWTDSAPRNNKIDTGDTFRIFFTERVGTGQVIDDFMLSNGHTFGTGAYQFTIDFVPISGATNPASGYGIVNNDYRMGTFEITNDQWDKFKLAYGTVTGSPATASLSRARSSSMCSPSGIRRSSGIVVKGIPPPAARSPFTAGAFTPIQKSSLSRTE